MLGLADLSDAFGDRNSTSRLALFGKGEMGEAEKARQRCPPPAPRTWEQLRQRLGRKYGTWHIFKTIAVGLRGRDAHADY